MSTYSLKQIYDVLQGTNFSTDNTRYVFLKLPKSDFKKLHELIVQFPDIYTEILNDQDELSVIMPKEVWNTKFAPSLKPLESMEDVALITCKVEKETVTGYLLAIVTMLSPHNISVFVQGAFTTDHIFVHYNQLDEALKLLNQLKS